MSITLSSLRNGFCYFLMQESDVTLANVMEMNIGSTKKPIWHQNSAKPRHTSAPSDLSLDFTLGYIGDQC